MIATFKPVKNNKGYDIREFYPVKNNKFGYVFGHFTWLSLKINNPGKLPCFKPLVACEDKSEFYNQINVYMGGKKKDTIEIIPVLIKKQPQNIGKKKLKKKHKKNAQKKYGKYLLTDTFDLIRQSARKEADGKCRLCNSTIFLITHHRTYKNRGVLEKEVLDCVTICQRCHKLIHDNIKIV